MIRYISDLSIKVIGDKVDDELLKKAHGVDNHSELVLANSIPSKRTPNNNHFYKAQHHYLCMLQLDANEEALFETFENFTFVI